MMKVEISVENIEKEKRNSATKVHDIESIKLGYNECIKLIISSLELSSKLRLLDLYFGETPLISYLFKTNPISYFGFETSNELIGNMNNTYQYHIKQRKAVFGNFDGVHIPYVVNFFHRVLSINPRIDIELFNDYLKEVYRVMIPGGTMVLTYKVHNYEECLKLIGFIRKSPFIINDLKVLNLALKEQANSDKHRSAFFVLSKPIVKELSKEESN